MKNKKGFTLVELLAVIVILGVLLLIAVPAVTSIQTKAKKSAAVDNALMLVKAVETCIANEENCTRTILGSDYYEGNLPSTLTIANDTITELSMETGGYFVDVVSACPDAEDNKHVYVKTSTLADVKTRISQIKSSMTGDPVYCVNENTTTATFK